MGEMWPRMLPYVIYTSLKNFIVFERLNYLNKISYKLKVVGNLTQCKKDMIFKRRQALVRH